MALSTEAYVLAKGYTKKTANSLGAVKGAACTVKDTTKVDGETTVTLGWEGTNGATETTQFVVSDGKSAYQIALDNGFVGTEEEWLESLKMDATELQSVVQQEVTNQIGNTVDERVEEKVQEQIETQLDSTIQEKVDKAIEDALGGGSGDSSEIEDEIDSWF